MRLRQVARARFHKVLFLVSVPPVALLALLFMGLFWPESMARLTSIAIVAGFLLIFLLVVELRRVMGTYEAALIVAERRAASLASADLEVRLSRERLIDSELRFRLIAETIPHMVWTADAQGVVDYCNARFTEYTGMGCIDMTGSSWTKMIHPENLESVRETWEAAKASGQSFCSEYRVRNRSHDTYRWHLSQAMPVRSEAGVVIRWFGTLTDIEEQKQVYQEAKLAIRMRDEFLSIASHELRTPLTALMLQLQLIERGFRQKADLPVIREAKSKIDFTLGQAKRLSRLIDTALDISRLANGPIYLNKSATVFDSLVAKVVSLYTSNAHEAGSRILLTTEGKSFEGIWDGTRLEQAVVNLISNAVKFGSGNPIAVRIIENEEDVLMEVEDQGLGMPPEDLDRIFDRFEHAKGHEHISGLGLGLYLTKQIAEAHGGAVFARSEPTRGSVFTLKLPRQAASSVSLTCDSMPAGVPSDKSYFQESVS